MGLLAEKVKRVSKWLIPPLLFFALCSFLILGFNSVIKAKGVSKSNFAKNLVDNQTQTPSPTPILLTKHVLGVTAKSVLIQMPTPTKVPVQKVTQVQNQNSIQTLPSNSTSTPTQTPTSTPSQAQDPVQNLSTSDYLLAKVNEYRTSQGLLVVQSDTNTCNFAKKRAEEISTNFNHDGFNNLPYPSYSKVTENIAENGNYTDVVTGWINSPGHAQNMREDTPYVCIQSFGDYYVYEGWMP